jgi:hypothetical protein
VRVGAGGDGVRDVVLLARGAEVHELGLEVAAEEEVLILDVAVDVALLVQLGQPAEAAADQVLHHQHALVARQRAELAEHLLQAAVLGLLHRVAGAGRAPWRRTVSPRPDVGAVELARQRGLLVDVGGARPACRHRPIWYVGEQSPVPEPMLWPASGS